MPAIKYPSHRAHFEKLYSFIWAHLLYFIWAHDFQLHIFQLGTFAYRYT